MKNKVVLVSDLGKKAFNASWDLQSELFAEILQLKMNNKNQASKQTTPNHLLLVEHPNVFTMGKESNKDHLLISEAQLQQEGIELCLINRGGNITYHGPGQLVCYPIFDLENFFTDIHRFVRALEEVVILTLADYGIKGGRICKQPGVWLDIGTANERKICAIGIRTSRWISMHGFALNIDPDLSYFSKIIPCGLKNAGVTSIAKELSKIPPMAEVKTKILGYFAKVFEAEVK